MFPNTQNLAKITSNRHLKESFHDKNIPNFSLPNLILALTEAILINKSEITRVQTLTVFNFRASLRICLISFQNYEKESIINLFISIFHETFFLSTVISDCHSSRTKLSLRLCGARKPLT